MMEEKAFAKVNLTLEILSKRADGFHEIQSVLQTIDIYDSLFLEPAPDLVLEEGVPGLPPEDNLVMRAARLLQKETGTEKGARLRLRKRIPVAAGLGGGSSDAAATLRGLNRLWGLGLDTPRLEGMAAQLGSDVPFFIRGGTALVQGRGEVLTQLPDVQETWFVLACLPIQLPNKTAELYKLMVPRLFTRGEHTRMLVFEVNAGNPVRSLYFNNAFEGVAFVAFTGLREFYHELEATGADRIRLSGSGPTLFSMVEDEVQGRELLLRCDRRGLPAYLVKTVAKPL